MPNPKAPLWRDEQERIEFEVESWKALQRLLKIEHDVAMITPKVERIEQAIAELRSETSKLSERVAQRVVHLGMIVFAQVAVCWGVSSLALQYVGAWAGSLIWILAGAISLFFVTRELPR